MNEKLHSELNSFQSLWKGGYYEGDPLNPIGKSGYGQLGFISTLHATYLRCIKPYINSETVSLEIGPGRGCWTKALLPSREIVALDALPEENNRFFEYLGYPDNVRYFHVMDFGCEMLQDNYFDYMFSFGCLCHVSFEGITEYAKNLYPKLKSGSNCFWMVADYDKYNKSVANLPSMSIWSALAPGSRKFFPVKYLFRYLMNRDHLHTLSPDEHNEPIPGRWYDAGIERTCSMLEEIGYKIVDPDVGTCLRDPVIHFIKQ